MTTYVTVQGDTFDRVAKAAYGNERRMDALIRANPDHAHVVVFPAGVTLNIPALPEEQVDVQSLPPWRRG